MRDACVGFPLLHTSGSSDLCVFIMITVCGSSKVESRELGTSVHHDPSFLSASRLVYDLVP